MINIKKLLNDFNSFYKFTISRDPVIKNDKLFKEIYFKCKPFTMTSIYRMYALYQSVKYVCDSKIEGDLVECGVWKGGSIMVMLETLLSKSLSDRKVFLYDTFKGMSKPTIWDEDTKTKYNSFEYWYKESKEGVNMWCYSPLDEVRRNIYSTNYPKVNIKFVEGKVEDTIPLVIPEKISILRLDTDFYESTKHELTHLFPKLTKGGVLIIDDYGHWSGARKAVDEYISENKLNILLCRVDYTGRVAIKN